MKLYSSLSKAIDANQRKPKEVIAIISFNGQAYFVFRSNPNAKIATIKQAFAKMTIGNELKKDDIHSINPTRKQRLYQFMMKGGIAELFSTKSHHAEENLIQNFSLVLNLFKTEFPNKIIKTIDIFLTHSPCSEQGMRKHSKPGNWNSLFLPAGCDRKLAVFFGNDNYKLSNETLFAKHTKIKIRYLHVFNSEINHEDNRFIKKADFLLQQTLMKL